MQYLRTQVFLMIPILVSILTGCQSPGKHTLRERPDPLRVVVDLNAGDSLDVELADGLKAAIKLLATDFGLVRYVSVASTPGLIIPGSILKGDVVNPKSPIVYGYDNHIPLFHSFGVLFDMPEEEEKYTVIKYSGEDDICMSGIVQGKDQIRGKAALVDVPIGEGHVVLFNFNPIHRFQNKVDFMLVFNILLNFDDLDASE